MKKIAILDFDGTIADTRPVILNTFHRTLDAMHLPQHTDDEIAATIGLPLMEAFPVLEPMDERMAAECTATYRRIFHDVNAQIGVPMFPHVDETLRLLDDIVTYIIGYEDVSHAKPHPEPVLKTLSHFGLTADDAVVVGDTHFDILMGRNAGCATIGVTYGNGSRQSLEEAGADSVVDDFADISRI